MDSVLVIDDEELILEIITEILEDGGYQVEALTHARNLENRVVLEDFDCALIDVNLPGKNGDVLAQEIKTNPKLKHLAVLLMSADVNLKSKANRSHADGYLEKPFENQKLLDLVGHYCSPEL